jgi:hypothetical protein
MKNWPALRWATAAASMILGTTLIAPAFGVHGLRAVGIGILLGALTLLGLTFAARVEPENTVAVRRRRTRGLTVIGVLLGFLGCTQFAVDGGMLGGTASLVGSILALGLAVYEEYQLKRA